LHKNWASDRANPDLPPVRPVASLRLCHLGNKFHEVLQMTKLLTVFDVYDTEATAVSSFQSYVAASN
jgi:hypothetical protein